MTKLLYHFLKKVMGKIIKKIDEFDNIHYIESENELGRGGQGVVYKTKMQTLL